LFFRLALTPFVNIYMHIILLFSEKAARQFSLALSVDDSIVDANYNIGVIAHTCGQPLLAVPYLKKVYIYICMYIPCVFKIQAGGGGDLNTWWYNN
jgi:hypothetical protein